MREEIASPRLHLLAEAMKKYSVDAVRFALADSGDSVDDANFLDSTAQTAVLRLHAQIEWIREALDALSTMREDEPSIFDRLFASEIDRAILLTEANYERMKFRAALRTGFWSLLAARDNYRLLEKRMHRTLVERFIGVHTILLAPICPHWCEYVWTRLLRNDGSVRHASWPTPGQIEEDLLEQHQFVQWSCMPAAKACNPHAISS